MSYYQTVYLLFLIITFASPAEAQSTSGGIIQDHGTHLLGPDGTVYPPNIIPPGGGIITPMPRKPEEPPARHVGPPLSEAQKRALQRLFRSDFDGSYWRNPKPYIATTVCSCGQIDGQCAVYQPKEEPLAIRFNKKCSIKLCEKGFKGVLKNSCKGKWRAVLESKTPTEDDDNDGVINVYDRCPSTPEGDRVWTHSKWTGCAEGQTIDPRISWRSN